MGEPEQPAPVPEPEPPKESLSARIERAYDKALGFTTSLVRGNPRKAALGIMILIVLLFVCLLVGD